MAFTPDANGSEEEGRAGQGRAGQGRAIVYYRLVPFLEGRVRCVIGR